MSALALLRDLRSAGAVLEARGDRLHVDAPAGLITPEMRVSLARHKPELLAMLAGNLLLPLTALFFAAGLSIICHFLRRWLRTRILRAGLYALAAYFPINVGVALLGLFDWYVDFRRRGGEGTERS